MKKSRLITRIFLAIFVTSFVTSHIAAAIKPNLEDFYGGNDIIMYDQDSEAFKNSCTTATGGGSITGSNNIEMTLNTFTSAGLTLEQAAGIAGNFTVESGSKDINPASNPHADAYGIAQWGGVRKSLLMSFAKDKGTEWTDMKTQLLFTLWEIGQGGSWNGKANNGETASWAAIKSTKTPEEAAESWMVRFERPNPNKNHLDRRQADAREIYEKYKGNTSLNTEGASETSSNGGCSSTAVQGDIAQTAKNLAWAWRVELPFSSATGYGKDKAKPEFVTEANKLTSDYHTAYYTDCGVFVATVMRASNVDPEYPARGTSVQMNYLQNSAKYETFYPKAESDMQPGDILIRDGHTYLYVGSYTTKNPQGKEEEWSAVGASLYTRPPSGHDFYLSSGADAGTNPFMAARYKG